MPCAVSFRLLGYCMNAVCGWSPARAGRGPQRRVHNARHTRLGTHKDNSAAAVLPRRQCHPRLRSSVSTGSWVEHAIDNKQCVGEEQTRLASCGLWRRPARTSPPAPQPRPRRREETPLPVRGASAVNTVVSRGDARRARLRPLSRPRRTSETNHASRCSSTPGAIPHVFLAAHALRHTLQRAHRRGSARQRAYS